MGGMVKREEKSSGPPDAREEPCKRSPSTVRNLNLLAAFVWSAGGVVLLFKGGGLLMGSVSLFPGTFWPWVAAVAGVLLGTAKGKIIFSNTCRKNLNRISRLTRPRIWQFFSPRFFLLLCVMIGSGIILSRLAYTSLAVLIGVAVLDLAVGTALLASSHVFWREKALFKGNCTKE